ncbi:MAG TPA: bifunctional 2-polyprenyl-6-hydroxyphenol methylase/3-demethylubiquinol 3-O-methyltransferase UbiG [Syntrophorhabdaceae bacterium]|nr:bifunctional 2-polyprenyl-6-hydroxyphenol methylase/3-demethylubiquinol 3-O-methyltransferase UbiG [Syntrophorhabdaceae bacterium]
MKQINNDYDSLAHLWWAEDEGAAASIRYLVNPVRFTYFKNLLERQFAAGFERKKALDVGCGGGFLSEELCRIGLNVSGIDPSRESINIANQHAIKSRLPIEYREAFGEALPFDDGTFDMVFCCDVLEHVGNIQKVISEISRVLKTGGLFFFDTINRTLISRIAVIYFMQKCRYTSFAPKDTHVWQMFIKPDELKSILSKNRIFLHDMKGIAPEHINPLIIIDLYKASRKKISYKELAQRLNFTESNDLESSYMGYGTKQS